MKGKVKIAVKNRNVSFNFTLERNITILTGDSGTGKTKLINMIRDYSQFGKSSGVTLERVHIKTASKIIASMITERKTTSSLS